MDRMRSRLCVLDILVVKIYDLIEFEVHTYATMFRPHFNLGISISLISLAVSLVFRLISDNYKKKMREEMCKVR